jgi:uncharacterized protein with PIN domain
MTQTFLIDGMLGSLNRWLRICGFDAKYIQNAPDEELLDMAKSEGRALLTRDRLLHRKALRVGQEALLVEGDGDAERLASVAKRFGLDLGVEMSRCAECGGLLRAVSREGVRDRVPSGSYEAYDEFWGCGSCGKVYWRGSHWGNIVDTVSEARRLASRASEDSEQDL